MKSALTDPVVIGFLEEVYVKEGAIGIFAVFTLWLVLRPKGTLEQILNYRQQMAVNKSNHELGAKRIDAGLAKRGKRQQSPKRSGKRVTRL